jgi:putative two-component system response regulator
VSAAPDPATVDVLVVDDQEQVRSALGRIISAAGYACRTADSVSAATRAIEAAVPDVVLCDIDMPGESGLVLVARVQQRWPDIGVLMVTAYDDPAVADQAMDLGALGYVIKPFERNQIVIQLGAALRHRRDALDARSTVDHLQRAMEARTHELQASLHQLDSASAALDRSREEELRRLACAAEFRDPETAAHLERMSRYCAMLARAHGLDEEHCEVLRLASPMHDVGKIGIPDEVLLKTGTFTDEDRAVMQRHTHLGHDLLAGSGSPLLELAATVAHTHHEWVDGSGYPRGLVGDEIPVEGRITAIADVYDALMSVRRYKRAYTHDEAKAIMQAERGTHFDADLLDLFFACEQEIWRIRRQWSDVDPVVA